MWVLNDSRNKLILTLLELYEKVMLSLRKRVRETEDNELYETMLLRGSQAGLVQPPSTNDIDQLMRSMMGSSIPTTGSFARRTWDDPGSGSLTPGPWLKKDVNVIIPFQTDEDSEADAEFVFASLGAVGRRNIGL